MENKLNVNIIADDGIVVPKAEYDELLRKVYAFDLIVEDTKRNIDNNETFGFVSSDLVMLVTGMRKYLVEHQQAKVIIDQTPEMAAEMGVLHRQDMSARKVPTA